MTKTINNPLNDALLLSSGLLVSGAVVLFAFIAENIHQMQHIWQHQDMTLEYKPIKSANKISPQTYSLETYKTMHDEAIPRFLPQDKNLNKKSLAADHGKSKPLDESQIVDHQIFASPNNIRSGKKIFI